MRLRKILVLVHKNDAAFPYFKYLIKLLMKDWKRMGLTVEVARGIDHFVLADVVIPHLDMTIMPRDYQNFLRQYPVVLNRHVVDISKSKISANILRRDDAYDGPVIVKTDFNSGGLPEKRLSSNLYFVRALSAKLTMPFRTNRAGQTAWGDVRTLDSSHYPVFPSLQEVPKEIFDNKNLVTEKFIPEIEDGKYCVRYYHFLGDREVCEVFRSHNKIVKGSDEGEIETSPLPSELYEIRQQLGMDYGKIDFVVNEGKVVLLDVNPTPGLPSYGNCELARRVAHQLADGILSKLD